MSEPIWEVFCDESYYGMWAVRRVGDRDFNSSQLFHVTSKDEAEALRAALIAASREALSDLIAEVRALRKSLADILAVEGQHGEPVNCAEADMRKIARAALKPQQD